jgi:hypothetical protein
MHLVRQNNGVIYIDELDLVGLAYCHRIKLISAPDSRSETYVQHSAIVYLSWILSTCGMVAVRIMLSARLR